METEQAKQLRCLRDTLEAAPRRDATRARPRLVLHIGTPKTGTTALQSRLGASDETLRKAGWIYPAWTDANRLTRHQYLVQELLTGRFAVTGQELAKALGAGVPNIMVSSEGLFAQRHRFRIDFCDFLSVLKEFFDVEVACVFRRPEDFSMSLYRQFIISNPSPHFSLMGYAGSYREFLDEPVVRDYLDYDRLERLFVDAGIRFSRIAYDADIIRVFEQTYFHTRLPDAPGRSNPRSTPEYYDLLRLHNAIVRDAARKHGVIAYVNKRRVAPKIYAATLEFFEMAAAYSGPVEFVESSDVLCTFAAGLADRFQQDWSAGRLDAVGKTANPGKALS